MYDKNTNALVGGDQYKHTCQNGKSEPVAMDSIAKTSTVLNCGFDDIVEIEKGSQ